jgi:RHS repeat-associated protein
VTATIPLASVTDRNGNAVRYAYNADGTLQRITDAAGRATTFTYDANKRCTAVTLPDGKTLTYTYDEGGNLIRSVDLLGTATEYAYNAGYFLTSFAAAGRTTAIAYADTSFGRRVSAVTDAAGYVTRYATDAANPNLTRITDPRGGATEVEHSGGRTTSIKDPLGNVTRTAYDTLPASGSFGLPISITYPDGTTAAMAYDSRGNLTQYRDGAGNVTAYAYDAKDRRTTVTDALNGVSRYAYDSAGNPVSSTSPSGRRASFAYDAQGNLISMSDPMENLSVFGYDQWGNVAVVTGPLGNATSLTYDDNGLRLLTAKDTGGRVTGFNYDALGRIIGVNGPDGSIRRYGYEAGALTSMGDGRGVLTAISRDPLGNITRIADRRGAFLSFSYDGHNNLVAWNDILGLATTRTYDGANRLTGERNPAGETVRWEYDGNGRIAAFVDQGGQRTSFSYDGRGLLVSAIDSLGTVTWVRDALGRITARTDATGSTVGYRYDDDGRLVQKRHGDQIVTIYGYDPTGNLASVTDADETTSYNRDALGRLTGIAYPGGLSVSMTYDASGNVTTLTMPGGMVLAYGYDARHLLTSISWGSQSITFDYDGAGRLASERRTNGTETGYRLDDSDKVAEILHKKGGSEIARLTYVRDASGNTVRERISLPSIGPAPSDRDIITTFDEANRVLKSGQDTYHYDGRGNLTGVVDGSGAQRLEAAYDAEHRPLWMAVNGAKTYYTYNGLGQMIQAVRGTETRRYHYDLRGRLLLETDGAGQVSACYVYGGDRLLAMRRDGADYFYHFDKTGNTLAMTDVGGNVIASYAYLPFGVMTSRQGALANRFTYVGAFGVMEEGDGLYRMGSRHYDAQSRRFLQRDPIGLAGGINLYAYAGNNPIDRIDPAGTDWRPPYAVAGAYREASAPVVYSLSQMNRLNEDRVLVKAVDPATLSLREQKEYWDAQVSVFNKIEAGYYLFDKLGGAIPGVGDVLTGSKVLYQFLDTGLQQGKWKEAMGESLAEIGEWGAGKYFETIGNMKAAFTASLWLDLLSDTAGFDAKVTNVITYTSENIGKSGSVHPGTGLSGGVVGPLLPVQR